MAFFRCGVTSGASGYEIIITTTSTEFYGLTITIQKDGATVGTTTFSPIGKASYRVDETGTYTVSVTYSGTTYTEAVIVSGYSVELEAGFQYKKWLGLTDLDPDDYASLAAVLADEKAVRQLMTVHASVDYLASFTADDASVVTILNDDICAKWITCTAYAEDVLTDAYGALMESIGKYGYGKWGITDDTTTPPTWGALGNVPIMTSNTAPYGTASAYQVFDGKASTTASGTDFSYAFTTPVCPKDFICKDTSGQDITGGTLQASNDGSTWVTPVDGTYYLNLRVHFTASKTIATLQFYGRQMSVSVPKMDSNTSPYGEASASSSFGANYPAYKAFDGDVNTLWASVEDTSDQWVEYEFSSPVKLYEYYIKPSITISGSTEYTKTAQVSVQGYIDGSWVDISEKTLVSNPTASGANTTPAEIRGDITSDAEISRVRVNFGEKVGVQRDCIFEFQVWGFDYSEKEWDTEHPRHYIYDHGVELEELTGYKEGSDAFYEKRPYELCTGGVNNYIAEFYAGKIDLTNYSLMRAAFGDELISVYVIRIASVVPYTLTMHDSNLNIIATKSVSAGDGSLPNGIGIDISSVNGEYYPIVYIAANTSNTKRRGTITELWLE